LKKSKYFWLKSESKLTVNQKEKLSELLEERNLKTAEAYCEKLSNGLSEGINSIIQLAKL